MMHVSMSHFDSAPRAGFGLLSGSCIALQSRRGGVLGREAIQHAGIGTQDRRQHLKDDRMRYPRAIANEGPQDRMSALNHQRLDAVSSTGAGVGHGGGTP